MTDLDQTLTVERAAQLLADAIGPRRPWVLVVDDPEGERLYTSETSDRARSLLRRAAERRRS